MLTDKAYGGKARGDIDAAEPRSQGDDPAVPVRASRGAAVRLQRTGDATTRQEEGRTSAMRRLWNLPDPVWVAVILAALVAGWAVALTTASPAAGSRHVFYVPIVLAAVRFGWVAAGMAGVCATLLAGPLSVPAGIEVWLPRGPFFVGIGVLVAVLSTSLDEMKGRETEVAEQRRLLADQRALLVQSVSHEFRTPLTVIRAAASMLSTHPELVEPRARPVVESMLRSSRRLEDLVAVVLAAGEAASEEQPEAAVDVEALVADVARRVPGAADRLRVGIGPHAGRVVTVPPLLHLLVRCLLDNAVKFSPTDTAVEVIARREGPATVLEVRDRGQGMTADEIRRSFDAFRQFDRATADVRGGLGIGLFTAERLARRIAADLELEPRQGGGLVARVVLPQRRATDDDGEPRAESAAT